MVIEHTETVRMVADKPQGTPVLCLKCGKILMTASCPTVVTDSPVDGKRFMIRCRNCKKENYISAN